MVIPMFSALARFAGRYRYYIVAGWVVLAAAMVVGAPSLSRVGITDQAQFLPEDSPSTVAAELLDTKFAASSQASPSSAVIVVYNPGGLNAQDMERAQGLRDWLVSDEAPGVVSSVVSVFDSEALRPSLVSQDGTTMLMTVDFTVPALDDAAQQAIDEIRAQADLRAGTEFYVTGDAGLLGDLFESIQEGIDRTTFVTIALVMILLLIVYRSPVAALVPLMAIGFSYLVARGAAGFLAQAGVAISTVVDAYLVVTIFGVGTDYCLFIVSRFREEMGRGDRARTIDTAMRRIGPVILASAVTVIIAFLCLSVSRFSMTRTSGWTLAIGITITLAAGLTLVPALMSIFGRYLFWPVMTVKEKRRGRFGWAAVGRWVSSHPVAFAAPIIVLLALPYIAFSDFRLSANVLAQLPPGEDSTTGLNVLRNHFPSGRLSPLHLVIDSEEELLAGDRLRALEAVAGWIGQTEGIASVDYFSAPAGQTDTIAGQIRGLADSMTGAETFDVAVLAPLQSVSGQLRMLAVSYPAVVSSTSFTGAGAALAQIEAATAQTREPPTRLPVQQFQPLLYALADGLSGLAAEFRLEVSGPFVDWLEMNYFSTDGTIARMDLILAGDPYSDEVEPAVAAARTAARDAVEKTALRGAAVYVGGEPAVRYDILQTSEADFILVLIFATIGILLVITVLLRSLLAPVYMVATVLLNYGATLGISAWLFLDVLDVQYLIYMLPSLVFIVLAAVGADYNIFLVSRIREESEHGAMRPAVERSVANTGGVITSCGIILAGTFATLGISELPVMYEIGVPIAIGVLIDTFIVRALLVPSLATLAGRWSWWPSRLSRKDRDSSGSPPER